MATRRVVTVTSNKGGVGKTTVATNLAVTLRALDEDLPVLVLSLDEQGLVDRMFGLGPAEGAPTIGDAIRRGDLRGAIRLGQYGVHYVPTDPAADELKREIDRDDVLHGLIEASGWAGVVVIDTKSDLEILTRNAIAASDLAILPVSDHPSLLEAEKVYRLLDGWGWPHSRARVLLSLIDLRVKYAEGETRDVLALLVSEIRRRGYPLFETFLSRSPKIESLTTNVRGRALPILHEARGSLVHRQMRCLAEDVRQLLADPGSATVTRPGGRRPHVLAPRSTADAALLDVDVLLGTAGAGSEATAPRDPAPPPAPTPVADPTEPARPRAASVERVALERRIPVFRRGEPPIVLCRSLGVTRRGIEIAPPEEIEAGERVHLVLEDPGAEKVVLVWGRAEREGEPGRWWLRFEESDEPARRAIEALLADGAHTSGSLGPASGRGAA